MTDADTLPPAWRRLLRIANWCAILPGGLGVAATVVWLASGGLFEEIASYYFAGLLAIVLGLVLLPVGLFFSLLAWRRHASISRVLLSVALLLANFPVAAACWWTANRLLDLHTLTVHNVGSRPVGPIRIWIDQERSPQDAWDIATLAPGESRLWSFHYAPEGSANFRATDGSLSLEAQPEERVFLGIGQPTEVRLVFLGDGAYRLEGAHPPRRWWWTGLRK